jgi:NADPH-dependent glutamate synthase beta subunit-like oxidoreductase
MRAFLLRRVVLVAGGLGDAMLIGSAHSAGTLRLRGFLTDLSAEDLSSARWPLARAPFLFETNRHRVFAVGDVRAGNVKRIAAAVGEGSVCVELVHRALAE